ncbi:MAG: S1C family serine protease [Planctomycetaceae bacterium]
MTSGRSAAVSAWAATLTAVAGLAWGGVDAEAPDFVSLCVRVRPAFVFIGGGSGVVIRPDGLMLTNDHVVENKRNHAVRLGDGSTFRARLLGTDPYGDLAVLKLELPEGTTVPHLELGDSGSLAVGDDTLAVGNPFGLGVLDQAPTFTAGIVSALDHTQGTYTECIVTDAEVNPGNSGGPLIDLSGRVVGINGQISTRFGLRSNTGLGFAISARQIALWLPRLEAAGGGEVKHGRIAGLEYEATDRPAVVADVAEGSPAAAAGFRAGDTIVTFDGADVPTALRLDTRVGMYPEGHECDVVVRRDGAEQTLSVTLAAPRRCPIGIRFERPRDNDLAVRVAAVEAESAAAAADLRAGDEIVALDGRPLEFTSRSQRKAFERELRTGFEDGKIYSLTVRRPAAEADGAPTEVEVRLVAR